MSGFGRLVRRELMLALRQPGDVASVLMFFVLATVLFPFGVGPEPGLLARIAGKRTEIGEAQDGMDGWRKISGDRFDLVLIDINMPVMDGLKLIGLIRNEDDLHDVPIVVITSETAQPDRERALNLGANEYLTKPIQTNRVLAVAKSLLKMG